MLFSISKSVDFAIVFGCAPRFADTLCSVTLPQDTLLVCAAEFEHAGLA